MTSPPLTPAQTHALFDILIHHQLYAEIEAFKYPQAISTYGYPFSKEDGVQTTSPLLQNMLNKLALRLPGLNNVGLDFWQEKVKVLVAKLGEAELSESYDKGAIGARKAMATAASSMLEYVARGILGGWSRGEPKADKEQRVYDTSNADDILAAWDDTIREVIYGNSLDEAFKKTAETGKLEDHSSMVQGAHEYILLNLASLLHHVFIMSPDGQYLLRLLENVHRLVPYYLVKQTLRVGNAATMINGMVKLVLTKLSVTAVTNWIGLTNNSNDGMNLMQQILSTVMAWDTSEFQRRAQKLESQKDAPDKTVFKAIKAYVYASRDTHEAGRNISIQESKSIVCVILETASAPIEPDTLTAHQHDIAMEHYSTLLSIRDREELTKILCKLQPDLLTSAIRDLVSAFDPVIRAVHNAVDLSGTVSDAESFLTDLIKISKPKRINITDSNSASRTGSANPSRSNSPAPIPSDPPASVVDSANISHHNVPTVEDYVHLLRKHIPSAHRFLHQVAKNAPELANQYLAFTKSCVAEFRMHNPSDASPPDPEESKGTKIAGGGAGNMTGPLHALFSTLPNEKQEHLRKLLDQHAKYIKNLTSVSRSRMHKLLSSTSHPPSSTSASTSTNNCSLGPSSANATNKTHPPHARGTTHGPGIYLARWHALLDTTLITPGTMFGPVRHGFEVKGELDGKGLKVDTLLAHKRNKRPGSSGRNTGAGVNLADGTGDVRERQERRRDGREEEKMKEVWASLSDRWVGVCKGLEIYGD